MAKSKRGCFVRCCCAELNLKSSCCLRVSCPLFRLVASLRAVQKKLWRRTTQGRTKEPSTPGLFLGFDRAHQRASVGLERGALSAGSERVAQPAVDVGGCADGWGPPRRAACCRRSGHLHLLNGRGAGSSGGAWRRALGGCPPHWPRRPPNLPPSGIRLCRLGRGPRTCCRDGNKGAWLWGALEKRVDDAPCMWWWRNCLRRLVLLLCSCAVDSHT